MVLKTLFIVYYHYSYVSKLNTCVNIDDDFDELKISFNAITMPGVSIMTSFHDSILIWCAHIIIHTFNDLCMHKVNTLTCGDIHIH